MAWQNQVFKYLECDFGGMRILSVSCSTFEFGVIWVGGGTLGTVKGVYYLVRTMSRRLHTELCTPIGCTPSCSSILFEAMVPETAFTTGPTAVHVS